MRNILLGVLWLSLWTSPVSAQSAVPPIGTVVVAHGGDSTWNEHVLAAARSARTGGPVEVSFLMGPAARSHRFQTAIARLVEQGAKHVVIVPLLVSSHSGHYEQIRYLAGQPVQLDSAMMHHLHMAGIERPVIGPPLTLVPALDDSPHMARVITDRARALEQNRNQAVFIVGHGPNSAEDYAAWMLNLRRVADSVKAWGKFSDVRVDVVRDDAPPAVRAEAVRRVRELIELQHLATRQPVIVVPVLISRGAISRDRLPNDLRGLPIVYAGEALLPHAEMSRWIEQRVRDVRTR